MGTTSLGVVGMAAAVLTHAAAFFFDFYGFGLRFLRPGRLPCCGHYMLLGSSEVG